MRFINVLGIKEYIIKRSKRFFDFELFNVISVFFFLCVWMGWVCVWKLAISEV